MTCTGPFADANDFQTRFCDIIIEEDEAEVNRILRLAASNIHAARAAQGACDCTLAPWATDYLVELNCIVALVTYNCNCSSIKTLSAEDRAIWADWARAQLEDIRTGRIELCDGQTGIEYPAWGVAQYSFTERNWAKIIVNDMLRNN